jgi:hypothetical protein
LNIKKTATYEAGNLILTWDMHKIVVGVMIENHSLPDLKILYLVVVFSPTSPKFYHFEQHQQLKNKIKAMKKFKSGNFES